MIVRAPERVALPNEPCASACAWHTGKLCGPPRSVQHSESLTLVRAEGHANAAYMCMHSLGSGRLALHSRCIAAAGLGQCLPQGWARPRPGPPRYHRERVSLARRERASPRPTLRPPSRPWARAISSKRGRGALGTSSRVAQPPDMRGSLKPKKVEPSCMSVPCIAPTMQRATSEPSRVR